MAPVSLGIFIVYFFLSFSAFAIPTRTEVYRNDKLHIIAYKDSAEDDVYWYLPKMRLYRKNGKVVHHQYTANDRVHYYFFIEPYMPDTLLQIIAREIKDPTRPGKSVEPQDRRQLRPLMATQFGIEIKQFNVSSLTDQVTNIQFLNVPQMISIEMKKDQTGLLDFLLNTEPGVPANILFSYQSENLEKYLKIELSHKEIYQALGIATSGRYYFTRAEIEANISNYLSNKYIDIKSKGDIKVPHIITRVINECFTPIRRSRSGSSWGNYGGYDDYYEPPDYPDLPPPVPGFPGPAPGLSPKSSSNNSSGNWAKVSGLFVTPWELESMVNYSSFTEDSSSSNEHEFAPEPNWEPGGNDGGGHADPSDPRNGENHKKRPASGTRYEFAFKPELATSDKTLHFQDQHYKDTSEMVRISTFLTLVGSSEAEQLEIEPIERKDFVVTDEATQTEPFLTDLQVSDNEQYIVQSVFAFQAAGPRGLRFYRWGVDWQSPYEDLYYRVGDGAWRPVGRRTILTTDQLYRGELQFFVDKAKIWQKIPTRFREAALGGLIPAPWDYKTTHPQFNLIITGQRIKKDSH